jgi:DNA-directed RNA polymerase I subunit RPA49
MKSQADTNRLIPCHNTDAADPSDVYAIKDIIPELELKAISVTALLGAQSDSQRIALLPFKRSQWVKHHLKSIFGQEPPSKSQM